MPQLSLYMDEPMMEGLRQDAAREGKTLSKFVAGVLRDRDTSGLWPHGFFDLYGACRVPARQLHMHRFHARTTPVRLRYDAQKQPEALQNSRYRGRRAARRRGKKLSSREGALAR